MMVGIDGDLIVLYKYLKAYQNIEISDKLKTDSVTIEKKADAGSERREIK